MKTKKEEFRIVEHHGKFHVEQLTPILWWSFYSAFMENTDELGRGGNILTFDTLDDARKFAEGCKKKYHKV